MQRENEKKVCGVRMKKVKCRQGMQRKEIDTDNE